MSPFESSKCRTPREICTSRSVVAILDQRQCADGAERLGFAEVVDLDPVAASVAEEVLDQLGQVAGGHGDVLEAVAAQLAYDDVQHRPVADRHQRLWQDGRVGAQARALAARQYHSALHRSGMETLVRARGGR